MYPAAFDYHAPKTVAEALALLEQHGDDAKAISGSMSLVPMMRLRLATPQHLVDLRKLPGLSGITVAGGGVRIGAMTTHREVERSQLARQKLPILAEAAGNIGDPQVRNKGTIGGSLAHADPSADWPAVALALGATVHVTGKSGERTSTIEELILGPLTTSLSAGELITAVTFPAAAARTGSAYEKCPHPASRFAIVGVAAGVTLDAGGKVQSARGPVPRLGPEGPPAAAGRQALGGQGPR